MSMTSLKTHVDLDDYYNKMQSKDSAAITMMCLNKLCTKAQELKDLYTQLARTYSIEMGICDVTLLVQVSSPVLPDTPVRGVFGSLDGIKHALDVMSKKGAKDIANMEKEEANDDKEQD